MDQIELRMEAARIAAQVEGVTTRDDFNEAARQRQELYHDMGIAPEPFTEHHPKVQCAAAQETAYMAPGGMPCSEAESMYLQRTP